MWQRCKQFARNGYVHAGFVAVVLLVTVAVAWLWGHEGHRPLPSRGVEVDLVRQRLIVTREAREALGVQVVEVKRRRVDEKVLAYATLMAPWDQHAYVTSRLPGKIVKLLVNSGETVEAGQTLAEVESLQWKTLQLALANARNDVQLAERTVQSLQPVVQAGAVAEQQLLTAQADLQQKRQTVAILHSQLSGLHPNAKQGVRTYSARLPIRSPITGVVTHTDLVVGKVIEPAEHLFEVVDLATVWVKIGVLEKDLHRVQPGQVVELVLGAWPGEVFHSKVQVKGLDLDPVAHVGTVWAELTNPTSTVPRFLPGMHGQAHIIISPTKDVLAIPTAALVRDGAERFVFVEQAATKKSSEYQKQNIVVGRQTSDYVEIRAGTIFPGDRVVIQGQHELAGFFVQGVLRPSVEASRTIGLKLEEAGRHRVESVIEVDGMVEVPPHRRTFVASQLEGTIHSIAVKRGHTVKAGDVVVEIASLELQDLQLDLQRVHLQHELHLATLKQLRSVRGVVTNTKIWETERLAKEAANRRDNLRKKLASLGLSSQQLQSLIKDKTLVEYIPVRAPLNGTIVHFDQVLGQAIKADDHLFEIHDTSLVWVQGFLSESNLSQVRLGQRARVTLVGDPNFCGAGKVVRSGQVLDWKNRTLSVWVEFDETPENALRHNMLARLTLTIDNPLPTLAVPLSAVVEEGIRSYVFVEQTVTTQEGRSENRLERRLIEIGRADDRFVEVVHGLRGGERVAVRGVAELQTAYASLR